MNGNARRTTKIGPLTAATTAGLLAFGAVAAALPGSASAAGIDAANGVKVDTFDSMQLLLPTGTLRGGSTISLTTAKNEYESFQLKVAAGAVALPGLSVSLARPLAGPNGATIPMDNVRFAREDYYKLRRMSDGELAAEFPRDATGTCVGDCRIPDALIPEKDILTNQDRAAFPVTVPINENRVAWVDVLAPANAAAGTYTSSVEVRSNGILVASVPLTVNVLNAALPSTATMTSQVFVNANDVGGSWSTYQQLAEIGLANRMSVVPDGFDPGSASAAGVLAPLINGTDPKVPLAGAHLTQLPFTHWADANRWRAFLSGLGKVGVGRFWCDEVSTATCAGWFNTAINGYPELKLQQIPQYQKPVTDRDLLDPRTQAAVPITTGLDANLGSYQQWKAASAGRELWSYTGCMQGGCTDPYLDNKLYNGTPGFGIDQPTSQSRAMGWEGFRAGLAGEHYWTAAGAFSKAWSDQYTAAGENTGMNGDGNLFYPFDQARVGGTTPIPVESLRLKRFRDGREDNELMQLLAGKGKGADAMAVDNSLFPAFDQTTRTPAQVATARASLESLIRSVFPMPSTSVVRDSQDLNCDGNADMLAVASDGRLMFYARRNGDWDPTAPTVVGSGWLNKYQQLLLPGDVNGDGKPDLLGRTGANTFDIWNGSCTGGFIAAGSLPVGFTLQDPTTPGDFDGDGKVDLMDRHGDGTLWLASGTGANGFLTPRQIGAGWTSFTIVGAGDADRDGFNDVFGRRSDGHVFLYRGNGRGGWITGNGEDSNLVLSPTAVPRLLGSGDMNLDGKVDMVVLDSRGTLLTYLGNGAGGWSGTSTVIGNGWNTVVAQIAD